MLLPGGDYLVDDHEAGDLALVQLGLGVEVVRDGGEHPAGMWSSSFCLLRLSNSSRNTLGTWEVVAHHALLRLV